MKKKLLIVLYSCLLLSVGISTKASATYAPFFFGGATQTHDACESATGALYYVNYYMGVVDSAIGATLTWSIVTPPTQGTAVVSYSVTTTSDTTYTSGATYTTTGGYIGLDSFQVQVTDGTNADTIMMYINVGPLPHAGTISGPTSLCAGTTAIYSSTTPGGIWFSANAHATIASDTLTAISAGLDSVIYFVSNSCGVTYGIYPITIMTTPAVGPITGAGAVCVGSTITLSAPFMGGTWSASNTNATVSGTAVTGVAGGVDTIMQIASNTCGTDSAWVVISIDTGVVAPGAITGADTMCAGTTITLANATAGGMWANNATLGTITGAGVLTALTTASGVDTVVYTLSNACGSATAEKVITINPLPVAGTITGYDSVCAGASITLTASTPGGVWTSSVPEFAAVDATGHVFGSLNGATIIRYTVTNSCGSATATHPVRVNVPAGPIAGSATLCQGSLGTYINGVAGGTWSSSNFLSAIPLFGGNYLGGMLGSVIILYTVDNACGTSTANLAIEVIDCNTGISNVTNTAGAISLAPNPNQGTFTIAIPSATTEAATVTITNMLGATVKQFVVNTNTTTEMNLDIPAGVYHVSATAKNIQYSAKMVIAQ